MSGKERARGARDNQDSARTSARAQYKQLPKDA